MPDEDQSDDTTGTPDPVKPCPLQDPYWIEIQLLDDSGDPVPNEEYAVQTPDGETVSGYLDSRGWARLAPLTSSGDCQVSFPNLDQSLWRFDHSEDALGDAGAS